MKPIDLALVANLIADAIEKHGINIKPAGQFAHFRDSLTDNNVISILWYNDLDDSTHIVKRIK